MNKFSFILGVFFDKKFNFCQNANKATPSVSLHPVVNIQNQPRMAYEALYRREWPDQYQPECRARRAARRLILVWPRASIHGPSRPSEVGCVFIIPSSILIYLFAIITLPKSTRRAPGRH